MAGIAGMVVVVTGGASGIGRATVDLLLSQGASVLVADLKQAAVDAVLGELQTAAGADRVAGCAIDVRNADDCERMMDLAERSLGEVDALVHCAGILRGPGSRPRPVYEVEVAEYDAVMDTNLQGTFLANRAALRRFVTRKRGQIVNLSSTSGLKGKAFDGIYSASKAGVINLSQSINEEMRGFGIRVQVVTPDAVDTPLWAQNGPINAAPQGALPAERVAEGILMCLALPADTMCENLILQPTRMRTRRKK